MTINDINSNIITCLQCDIVSWDSIANSWVISPAPSCNITVPSTAVQASCSTCNDGTATVTATTVTAGGAGVEGEEGQIEDFYRLRPMN